MPRFAAMLPETPPSDEAREGTCAAWVAEMVLTGEADHASDMAGQTHENGWLVEIDMVRYVQKYVDLIRSYGGEIHTERKVRLNQMIEGTPDAFAVLAGDGILRVDDLKYGFGIVEEYKNTQVMIYAGAILRYLMPKNVKIRKVVIGIYQPRAWHPRGTHRTWDVWPETLMKYVQEIERAGQECQDVTALATPGDHCEYCPAAATCTALAHNLYRGYRIVGDERQGHMTADEISAELDFLNLMGDMLSARKKRVEAEAEERMKRAEYIPRYGFAERRGNPKFTIDGPMLQAITGKDPYEKKIATPAEMIRRGADPEQVARWSRRPILPRKLQRFGDDHFERTFDKDTSS